MVGGLRCNATMSRTFSMKNGSVDSLKVCAKCGLTPKRPNQRCTVLLEIPSARPSARVLQCVALSGVCCNARLITLATLSSS